MITDYFSAPSDEAAAAVIDGGPSGTPGTGFRTIALNGIEPVVQTGTMEELLTGVDYETVAANPRQGRVVAVRDSGEGLVIALTDELRAALVQASEGELREVAGRWARTEEFRGQSDPAALAEVLGELASLARDAQARDEHLYCWVCI
ncbi:MAG TPA: hypothetical protein VF054_20635 [Micromonosporaceae bacterium]